MGQMQAWSGLIVLLLTAVAVSVLVHWRVPRLWAASALSAVLAVIVFFILCLLRDGMPEPLETRAIALFLGFAFLVAIMTGALAKMVRLAWPRRT